MSGGMLGPVMFFAMIVFLLIGFPVAFSLSAVGLLFGIGLLVSGMANPAKVLAFLDVTGRIAQTLLNLAKQPDAMTHPDGMQIKITRQEIGQIVGCSRETVGRILKMLEDQNLISAHGKTIVVYGTR